jgi:hypothetical protein
MATKKATKKVVKKATKRTAKGDGISWVLSERSKLFMWTPIRVYKSYDKAANARQDLEALSIYGGNGYKVSRVVQAD